MDYTLGYFNTRERLQWFVHHPLYYYRLLMTNPEYQQFYYSSKWDLQQSDMVRKVTRGSNRRPAILPALPSVGSGPPALTYGGGNEPGERPHHPYGNGIGGAGGITKGAVVTIIQDSEDFCPQCGIQYNTTKNRKVTEACNHAKCWRCIFESEEGCAQCRQTESPVVVEEPKQIYNHRSVNTRRSAAAARQQSATLSRGNSVNSARPSSSSPGSTSNDTGRQSSSVYSDSADSDSCLRFPTSGGVMEVNDSYPSTIDYETISVLTSPSLDNTQYVSLAEYNADSKSYNAIVEEENDFSISLTSGFRGSLPLNHNHNSGGGTRTSPILGSNTQGGLVTRGHTKEASDLTQSSPGSHSISTSPSSSKRRSRESPTVESVIGNKIASGGGSPDITQGVRSSRLSGRGEPEQRFNQLASRNVKIQKNQEPVPTTSYLNDLLTKGHKGGSANTSALIHSNKGNEKETGGHGAPVKNELGHSPSSHSSNDEQHNHDEEIEDGKPEEDDEGKGDEEPVPKKKKKRSPVVIHDHITILGGDPPMYQCNLCNKKFKTKAHIKYHEFCQKGDKPFKCEICGQGFIAKSHYEYHLRTHTGERPYVCPKCGKGFNQRGKVTRHMRSHTGEKPFICQECNRGFANAQALRCHTLIHTGERPFACTYCNKRFTGMTNLKKHVITHTGERPFSCNHCGKSFGLKWTLDLHLRTHSSERPYACDQCTRAFSNSKDLRRHLVIHSGERPFQCRICQTAFRRKDNLDRHIKNTHNQPKEIAKQLANEAASEYLKNNSKSQSLGNIPVSKVNSIVISNIIKKNDLMPASAMVPKSKVTSVGDGPSGSTSNPVPLKPIAAKVSAQTKQADKVPATASPSVQNQQKKQSPTSSSSSNRQRKVIITAPLSPPETRAFKSKKTDSSSPSASSKPSGSPAKPKVGVKSKAKPLAPAILQEIASPICSIRITQVTTLAKSPVVDISHPGEDEANADLLKPKKKSKKKKKKRSKKSSRSNREESDFRESREERSRVARAPSPQIVVESPNEARKRSKKSKSLKLVQVESNSVTLLPKRLDTTLIESICDRRPTLTLVTVQSPKEEKEEEPPSFEFEEKESDEMVDDMETESKAEFDKPDEVESILPHHLSEIEEEEEEEDSGTMQMEEGEEDREDDIETKDLTIVEKRAEATSFRLSTVEELLPVTPQPPELFEDDDTVDDADMDFELTAGATTQAESDQEEVASEGILEAPNSVERIDSPLSAVSSVPSPRSPSPTKDEITDSNQIRTEMKIPAEITAVPSSSTIAFQRVKSPVLNLCDFDRRPTLTLVQPFSPEMKKNDEETENESVAEDKDCAAETEAESQADVASVSDPKVGVKEIEITFELVGKMDPEIAQEKVETVMPHANTIGDVKTVELLVPLVVNSMPMSEPSTDLVIDEGVDFESTQAAEKAPPMSPKDTNVLTETSSEMVEAALKLDEDVGETTTTIPVPISKSPSEELEMVSDEEDEREPLSSTAEEQPEATHAEDLNENEAEVPVTNASLIASPDIPSSPSSASKVTVGNEEENSASDVIDHDIEAQSETSLGHDDNGQNETETFLQENKIDDLIKLPCDDDHEEGEIVEETEDEPVADSFSEGEVEKREVKQQWGLSWFQKEVCKLGGDSRKSPEAPKPLTPVEAAYEGSPKQSIAEESLEMPIVEGDSKDDGDKIAQLPSVNECQEEDDLDEMDRMSESSTEMVIDEDVGAESEDEEPASTQPEFEKTFEMEVVKDETSDTVAMSDFKEPVTTNDCDIEKESVELDEVAASKVAEPESEELEMISDEEEEHEIPVSPKEVDAANDIDAEGAEKEDEAEVPTGTENLEEDLHLPMKEQELEDDAKSELLMEDDEKAVSEHKCMSSFDEKATEILLSAVGRNHNYQLTCACRVYEKSFSDQMVDGKPASELSCTPVETKVDEVDKSEIVERDVEESIVEKEAKELSEDSGMPGSPVLSPGIEKKQEPAEVQDSDKMEEDKVSNKSYVEESANGDKDNAKPSWHSKDSDKVEEAGEFEDKPEAVAVAPSVPDDVSTKEVEEGKEGNEVETVTEVDKEEEPEKVENKPEALPPVLSVTDVSMEEVEERKEVETATEIEDGPLPSPANAVLTSSETMEMLPQTPSPLPPQAPVAVPVDTDEENSRPEATLPPDISEFVLSVLENKSERDDNRKADDLESISSESLPSPTSDNIKRCIQTLESDDEETPFPTSKVSNIFSSPTAANHSPTTIVTTSANTNMSTPVPVLSQSKPTQPDFPTRQENVPAAQIPTVKSLEERSDNIKLSLVQSPSPKEPTQSAPVASTTLPPSADISTSPKLITCSPVLASPVNCDQVESPVRLQASPKNSPIPVPEYKSPTSMVPQEQIPDVKAVNTRGTSPKISDSMANDEKYEVTTAESCKVDLKLPPPHVTPVKSFSSSGLPIISKAGHVLTSAEKKELAPLLYAPTSKSSDIIEKSTMPQQALPPPPPPLPPLPQPTVRANGMIQTVPVSVQPSTSTTSQLETQARGVKRSREEMPVKDAVYEMMPNRVQFILPSGQHISQHQAIEPVQQPVTTLVAEQPQHVAYDPSMLYFLQPDGQQAPEGNFKIVYAAAAATAEREEGVDGPPNKVRLLYAEALGVGSGSPNGNVQFYFTSTTPEQEVQRMGNSCHVQLMDPYRVTYSTTTDNHASEMLQYQVRQQSEAEAARLTNAQQHQAHHQQQVLNLSSGQSPVYYLSAQSSVNSQYHPGNAQMQASQQAAQAQTSNSDHGTYLSTSTAKLMMSNPSAYGSVGVTHGAQGDQMRQHFGMNGEIQDLSAQRRLELPVHMAHNNRITYAHVQSQDHAQYTDLLGKAREMQHVFPQGALRHCNSNMEYGNTTSQQQLTAKAALYAGPHHQQRPSNNNNLNGLVGGGNMPTAGTSGTGGGEPKLSGLDLLTAVSSRVKELEYEAMCTERAAAAIAAVGEIARRNRLNTQQQHQQNQQGGADRFEVAGQHHHLQPHQNNNHPINHRNIPTTSSNNVVNYNQQPQQLMRVVPPQDNLGHQHHQQVLHQQVQGQYQHHQQPPYQQHHAQHLHPQNFEGNVVGQEADQEAGIRRGPRKYYLSRSAHLRN